MSTQRAAVVEGGIVINVVMVDAEAPPAGVVLLADDVSVGPGWTWDGTAFAPPPALEPEPDPVPDTITDRQYAHALALAGHLTQDEALAFVAVGAVPAVMQGAIDAIQDEQARFAARMLVSGATQFRRASPFTEMLRARLGWSEDQVDELWRMAARL